MRVTKVYTRTGDKGTTRLVGGSEVSKDDARVEAYGAVDELNAILGLSRLANAQSSSDEATRARLDELLAKVQNDLFNVGADLSTPAASRWEGMVLVQQDDVDHLEQVIDAFNAELPPLKEFILPGGGPVGASLHQARTVCRRAERRVVTLRRLADDVDATSLRYLNRLSDLLFVAGRWAAQAHGEPEHHWQKPARPEK